MPIDEFEDRPDFEMIFMELRIDDDAVAFDEWSEVSEIRMRDSVEGNPIVLRVSGEMEFEFVDENSSAE